MAGLGDNVRVDGTYKNIWNGFPVLIVATSDKNRCLHSLTLSETTSETEHDFGFIFNALKKTVTGLKGEINAQLLECDLSLWVIDGMTAEAPLDARCTCSKGLELVLCNHVLGLGIRLGRLKVPAAAKDVPIGQKRNHGLPAKAKKALIIQ